MQTRAVVERTNELKAKHAAAVAALLQRYKQLRSEVTRYNKALDKVMSSSSSSGGGGSQQQQWEHDAHEAAAAAGGSVGLDDVYTGRDQ